MTSAYQKSFPYLPEGRKKAPFTQGSLLFVQTYLFANHHKVFVVLNLVLASTAFVSTNAKIRHTPFEICRIFENCPLGYNPIGTFSLFVLLISYLSKKSQYLGHQKHNANGESKDQNAYECGPQNCGIFSVLYEGCSVKVFL